MRDFKSDLQITEYYDKEADRALKSLQSEYETHLKKEGVLAVAPGAVAVPVSTGSYRLWRSWRNRWVNRKTA